MKQEYVCKCCGLLFVPKDSHINRPHLYCSRKCQGIGFSSEHPRKTNKEYYKERSLVPGYKDKKREADKKYSTKNKEKLRLKAIEYYQANKTVIKKKHKKYAKLNKEKKKLYDLANKDRIRKKHTEWCAKQRKNNPLYKLHDNINSRIARELKGKNKKRSIGTEKIMGYPIEHLKKHLEKQFTQGMNWGNYGRGGWVVDHIIPLRVFNITSINDIDLKRAWALKNLQPLWEHDNLTKSGKITNPFQPSLPLKIQY